jgi:endoglycosylceramidase
LTGLFQQVVYTPAHTVLEDWIDSGLGQQVDGLINMLAGSYVIGNGTAGTAANPTGGAAGWLFGDGGGGWDSIQAGVAGGDGGTGGMLGNGGAGGAGGAGAPGGAGGAGSGLVLGVGGNGGRGGDGGSGAKLLGSGGDGGDGGNSGVGGSATGLPALGGAGGDAGFLGSHGAVGEFGTGAALQDSNGSLLPVSTTGTWMTNGDGQVVLMHGLNEVHKEAPFEPSASGFGNDDAAFLAANGFNVVRLGVIWAGVEPQPGVFDTAYIDSIPSSTSIRTSTAARTGAKALRRGRRSPAGCPTLRRPSRSANSSIPRRRMPGMRSGRTPKHRTSLDSKTITRRCWKRLPATSTATPTWSATRS